jgi:hypothetical protein
MWKHDSKQQAARARADARALMSFFFFLHRVSLCSPGCLRTHSVDRLASHSEILLPLPPKCWD